MWIEHENTQVVQTSWAAMALMYAKYPHTEPIAKAVALVMSRQLPVRDFLSSGHISLIMDFLGRFVGTGSYGRYFQQNCTISYPNFKFSFTIWMLGKAQKYLEDHHVLL